jgi:hypothetical protein
VLRHGPTVLGHERRRAFRATGRIAGFRESVLGRNRAALVTGGTGPVYEVVKRELSGADPNSTCVSKDLLKSYVVSRMRDHPPGSGKVVDLSEGFFHLGAMLDWVGPQCDSIRRGSADMDEALRNRIGTYSNTSKRDARWLNEKFPRLPFNPSRPATFTYVNLVRTLIIEANPLKKGDGMDFCHAVMASTFASFAALDKHWKRRIEGLPRPNGLARFYSGTELDAMVADIEAWASSN